MRRSHRTRIWRRDSLDRDSAVRMRSGCQTEFRSNDGWIILCSMERGRAKWVRVYHATWWYENHVRLDSISEAMDFAWSRTL